MNTETFTVTAEDVDRLLTRAAFMVHQSRELDPTNSFTRHYLGKAEGIVGALAIITGRSESDLEVEVGRLAETL